MNAKSNVLLIVIGVAAGALAASIVDVPWWVWAVIAAAAVFWYFVSERQPDRKQANLLAVVADARIKGEAVRKDLAGMISMTHRVYFHHRDTIIKWTADTYSKMAAVNPLAAGRFGDEAEAEALPAHENVRSGNIGSENLLNYMDDRIKRLDEVRSG